MNAKGIGRALFQTWPGAAEAPVAATADTGMWVHSLGNPCDMGNFLAKKPQLLLKPGDSSMPTVWVSF